MRDGAAIAIFLALLAALHFYLRQPAPDAFLQARLDEIKELSNAQEGLRHTEDY